MASFRLWFALVPCLLFVAAPLHAQKKKPNIVVIVADDLGYADLGCQGCKDIATPNIDSIAKNGFRFTNGYVSAPLCSPTRAGVLTGRYQSRFGLEGLPGPDQGLPLTERTIANLLKALGYVTGLIGKWHLGSQAMFHPQNRGFDEFFGFLHGAHPFLPGGKKKPAGPLMRGTKEIEENDYLTFAFTREAVSFIDRHKNEPFILFVTYNAVHTPLQAPSPERLPKSPENTRKIYAKMLAAMDKGVGDILAKIRDAGLEEDTMIIFFSDNGGPTEETSSSNLPLRGVKNELWEGGVRIPFMLQWKGHLPAGKIYDHSVISLDIVPTAIAIVGGKLEPTTKMDGVNLMPYLLGKNTERPHPILYWRYKNNWAIRKDDWKLTFSAEMKMPHLADLAKDIGQKTDLVSQHPAVVRELQTLHQRWSAEMPVPMKQKGGKKQPTP